MSVFKFFLGVHSGIYSCLVVIKITVEKKNNIKDDCIKDVQLFPSFEMQTSPSRPKRTVNLG